jgi:electron transfer flavoprotein alpha subunit
MILAFIEHVQGAPTILSLEVLTFAQRLAQETTASLEAVVIGPRGGSAVGILTSYGVSTLHIADDPRLAEYAPAAWAHSIHELADHLQPELVIGTASDRGAEVMAHVAARMKLPLAANCTEVSPGDPFTVTRQRWGGSLLEEARLHGPIKLVTLAPHALTAQASPTRTEGATHQWTPVLEDKDFRVRLAPERETQTGKVSLAQARVVVGGGRGVGSAEGFALLEELAALLGGAVGCSRAVTSLGWRPHSDQVGQTGTRIAPDLYIACGISGAIQHVVGCRAAKHILAINTDPAAPIVAQADYAVIGDVQKVLTAVNAEIRRVKASEPSAASLTSSPGDG